MLAIIVFVAVALGVALQAWFLRRRYAPILDTAARRTIAARTNPKGPRFPGRRSATPEEKRQLLRELLLFYVIPDLLLIGGMLLVGRGQPWRIIGWAMVAYFVALRVILIGVRRHRRRRMRLGDHAS